MSKQIAVRLPDDLVEFVDGLVKSGQAGSRAAVVVKALVQAKRRDRAAADAAILAKSAADTGMDSLAGFAAQLPIDDLE